MNIETGNIIEDILNDIKHTTNQLKGMIDNLEHHLQQATKVEKKLKAYHVKDEYSYKCLMKELKLSEYKSGLGEDLEKFNYSPIPEFVRDIVIINDIDKIITFGDYRDFDIERVDLIEYHKEEPLYYAKIKGWELIKNDDCYWYKDENPIHGIYPWSREEASIYTKKEWNKLGINDTNADFEEIEVEE